MFDHLFNLLKKNRIEQGKYWLVVVVFNFWNFDCAFLSLWLPGPHFFNLLKKADLSKETISWLQSLSTFECLIVFFCLWSRLVNIFRMVLKKQNWARKFVVDCSGFQILIVFYCLRSRLASKFSIFLEKQNWTRKLLVGCSVRLPYDPVWPGRSRISILCPGIF